jgi:hypothetical protein
VFIYAALHRNIKFVLKKIYEKSLIINLSKNPAQRPDIRHEIFRAAFELKKECRPFAAIRSIDNITQIMLIPSAAGQNWPGLEM